MTTTIEETSGGGEAEATTPDQSFAAGGRTARSEVTSVLIGISLISVVLIGMANFMGARWLLNDIVESSLLDIGTVRAVRIENGLQAIQESTATMAADLGVVSALADFADAYEVLEEPLDQTQLDELAAAYDEGISAATPPGVEPPTVAELFPNSERARYLQYHYLLQNPFGLADRSQLIDPGDGSVYSEAHALHHPGITAIRDALGFGDVILVDADTISVVYTVDKSIDFGTSLVAGPHSESGLAKAILDELSTAAAGDAVVVDFESYAPARGAPTLFAAAAVRDGAEVIGALAVAIPNEALVDITTASQDWEGTGLGETGEVYVVGNDGLMRSESRLWLEAPEDYLERVTDAGYDPEVAVAVEGFGTTALIQPVRTEAVEAAQDGELFSDSSTNYLGVDTLTVAGPLIAGTLDWVVVAEVSEDEAYFLLGAHLRRVLTLGAILIPLLALIGFLLAKRLIRPVTPILVAARQVSGGDLTVELPAESHDEFGNLAANFNGLVEALREQEVELARAEAETTELLAAVLPDRVVDQVRSGESDVAEAVHNATVIVIAIDEQAVADPIAQQMIVDHGVELAAALAALADEHHVEPLRSSASRDVYATGLNSVDPEIDRALAFVVAARELVLRTAERDGLDTVFRAGLGAGDVVIGVIGTERISFDVWGEPRRQADALADQAQPSQILVGSAVTSAMKREWEVGPAGNLVDRTGQTIEAWAIDAPGTETPARTDR